MVSSGIARSSAKPCSYAPVGYSQEFEVKVVVHQGFLLSPLLFIIMLRRACHVSFVLSSLGQLWRNVSGSRGT